MTSAVQQEQSNPKTSFTMVYQPLLKKQLNETDPESSKLIKREIKILHVEKVTQSFSKKAGVFLAVVAIALPFFAAIASSSYLFIGTALLSSVICLTLARGLWAVSKLMQSLAIPVSESALAILKDKATLEEVSEDPSKLADRITKNVKNDSCLNKTTTLTTISKQLLEHSLTTTNFSENDATILNKGIKEMSFSGSLFKLTSIIAAFQKKQCECAARSA